MRKCEKFSAPSNNKNEIVFDSIEDMSHVTANQMQKKSSGWVLSIKALIWIFLFKLKVTNKQPMSAQQKSCKLNSKQVILYYVSISLVFCFFSANVIPIHIIILIRSFLLENQPKLWKNNWSESTEVCQTPFHQNKICNKISEVMIKLNESL